MVETTIDKIISDFKDGTIKSEERLILTVGRIHEYDISGIYKNLENLGFNIHRISNVIDSYLILSKGSKVDIEIKQLIENDEFIDKNHTVITDLAKIYFYSDSIQLSNNEIVIKREINCNTAIDNSPEINIEKAIQMTLQKIKYNKMDITAISKLHELEEYPKYKKLHDLLIKAIEFGSRIKTLDDDSCKMNLAELEQFIS